MIETAEPKNVAWRVHRLARFAVTTQDTERLVNFWVSAFDCREVSRTSPVRGHPNRVRLTLGTATVDVLEFDQPGRPYRAPLSPFDNEFQHFAIVVSDMAQAYARLCAVRGWTTISTSGPQRLPDTSGGVTAFKFRDPDGHPLEFLSFPTAILPAAWRPTSGNLFLGIDHSALSVADPARSIAFYQGLGLQIAARSYNHGIEQALLDGVSEPQVDVIALAPDDPTPHIELLFYRNAASRRTTDIRDNDVFASRLIFQSGADGALERREPRVLADPDGHRLEIH